MPIVQPQERASEKFVPYSRKTTRNKKAPRSSKNRGDLKLKTHLQSFATV